MGELSVRAETWARAPVTAGVRKPSCLWLAALAVVLSSPVVNAQTLPPARNFCGITAADLAGWFVTGTITANGAVNPADSVNFSDTAPFSVFPDCNFFRWGEQMFLWATSPAYGGALVIQSPVFFPVSVPQNGVRTLIPNSAGPFPNPTLASLRSSQPGRDGKRTTFRNGRMVSLEIPQVGPNRKTVIRNKTGELVEIWRTRLARGGKPVFLNKSGRVIDAQLGRDDKPFVLNTNGDPIAIAQVTIGRNGLPVFLTSSGGVIDIEQGQSSGEVLMSQPTVSGKGGSYVYYAIFVNDVFAYFMTAQKTQSICATQFPSTQSELDAVVNFANANGKTLPDANALAVEIKTAWVTASSLDNPADYIRMDGVIPTYDQTGVLTGSTQTTLALVGFHIAATAKGHPEMIWITFEHVNNTPNATYTWFDNFFGTHTEVQSTAGSWLFSSSTATSFNTNYLAVDPQTGNIIGAHGHFGPSDTLRVNAWGSDPTNAQARLKNSEVISFNNSVLPLLPSSDPRSQYMPIGGTWRTGGQFQGTLKLTNTTLETYQQPSNCFDCHDRNNMLGAVNSQGHTTGLSHIYGQLKQLFGNPPSQPPC